MRSLAFLLLLGFLRAQALAPGDKAPLLEAQDSYGRPVDLRGSHVVLWFYPKAKSPECTAQAKRYSELYEEFRSLGVRVYGVSHDPAGEQCDFIDTFVCYLICPPRV
jgi:peroxiredoxin Q/BCP